MVPGCVRRPDDGVTRTFYLRLSGQYSQRHLLVIPRDTGGTLVATRGPRCWHGVARSRVQPRVTPACPAGTT